MLRMEAVMIGSDDHEKLAEFYKKVFGEVAWQGGPFYGFGDAGSALMVGPHDKVKGPNPQPERIIFNLATDDVAGEFERIKGLGAEVVQEPYHPVEAEGMWLATMADPDGNYFQLATPYRP